MIEPLLMATMIVHDSNDDNNDNDKQEASKVTIYQWTPQHCATKQQGWMIATLSHLHTVKAVASIALQWFVLNSSCQLASTARASAISSGSFTSIKNQHCERHSNRKINNF